MTAYIILGSIIVIMGLVLFIVLKLNKGLRDDNKSKGQAIKQRDDNMVANSALQNKIANIKEESNNEKDHNGNVADWLNKL